MLADDLGVSPCLQDWQLALLLQFLRAEALFLGEIRRIRDCSRPVALWLMLRLDASNIANTDKVKMPTNGTDRPKWLVRIRPLAQSSVADLLRLPVPLDVWQRDKDGLVAAASDESLDEIERRKLARVERICSVADYVKRGWPDRQSGGGVSS